MPLLIAASLVLLGLRLWAAARVGFGDSEALYASWAVHPQPAYLDHPGLVGMIARAIGEGGIPTPIRAHVVTSIVATLIPWLMFAVARAAGAERRNAALAALVFALTPEIAVGLFALTPDLVLAPAWLGALGLAFVGMRTGTSDPMRAAALLGAGLLAGIGASAKVTGLLLILALAVVYAQLAIRRVDDVASNVARTPWPWAGLLAGIVVIGPVGYYESRLGFPMLRHRLIDTQAGAGFSFTNLGAVVGGQLAYLSPLAFWLAVVVAVDLFRRRHANTASRLLFASFIVPLAPLFLLCVWSNKAEPHWLAPPLLALPIHAALRATEAAPLLRARLVRGAAAIAGLFTLGAHAWVLIPASAALMPASVDPRADIASELFGWPLALSAVREHLEAASTPLDPDGRDVVVVGPHWTVCAQLHAALPGVRVGCATPIPDDFDRWLARDEWRRSPTVLFVTDNRFPGDGAEQLPAHTRVSQSRVRYLRGGRTARTFELYLYDRRGSASLPTRSTGEWYADLPATPP